MTNDTWGLNFTSPIDAKQFRECCVSMIRMTNALAIYGKVIHMDVICLDSPLLNSRYLSYKRYKIHLLLFEI